MEIDSIPSAHAVFDLGYGNVGVSVKEFKVTDAITVEEGAGYGAVESARGGEFLLCQWEIGLKLGGQYVLPHIACKVELDMGMNREWEKLTIGIEDAFTEDGVHRLEKAFTWALYK